MDTNTLLHHRARNCAWEVQNLSFFSFFFTYSACNPMSDQPPIPLPAVPVALLKQISWDSVCHSAGCQLLSYQPECSESTPSQRAGRAHWVRGGSERGRKNGTMTTRMAFRSAQKHHCWPVASILCPRQLYIYHFFGDNLHIFSLGVAAADLGEYDLTLADRKLF